jgi:hypothetical protein
LYAGEVIHYQLEADGSVKMIRLKPSGKADVTIAMPYEFDEPRSTPVHFLDREEEERFKAFMRSARVMRLSSAQLQKSENSIVYKSEVRGIRYGRGASPLMTISLPENAALQSLLLYDLGKPVGQIVRSIHKDVINMRYTIYICTSQVKDMQMEIEFSIDKNKFHKSNYTDVYTEVDAYPQDQILGGTLDRNIQILVQNRVKGDQYFIGQAGAAGPHSNMSFSQLHANVKPTIDDREK